VPALIELEVVEGRSGCRTTDEAFRLAAALTTLPHLELAGVETYENMFPAASADETVAQVDDLLHTVRTLVTDLDTQAFAGGSEVLVTAGQ
jgi:D-serine dehydratase